jgi:hypothetical protein
MTVGSSCAESQENGQVWWPTAVILTTQEAEVGRFWSVAGLGQSLRSYLKNRLKAKEQGVWL